MFEFFSKKASEIMKSADRNEELRFKEIMKQFYKETQPIEELVIKINSSERTNAILRQKFGVVEVDGNEKYGTELVNIRPKI